MIFSFRFCFLFVAASEHTRKKSYWSAAPSHHQSIGAADQRRQMWAVAVAAVRWIIAGKHRQSEILHNMGTRRRHRVSRQTEGWGWREGGGSADRLRFKFLFGSCKRLGAVIPLRSPQGHSDSRDVMLLLLSLKPRLCSVARPRRDIMAMMSYHIMSCEGYLFIYLVLLKSAENFSPPRVSTNLWFYKTGEIWSVFLASLVYNGIRHMRLILYDEFNSSDQRTHPLYQSYCWFLI